MREIKFIKRPKLYNPYLITAWPGMGEVAFKVVNFLIENLKAQEFAYIEGKSYFYYTGGVINDGILKLPDLPYNKFFYCKNVVIRSELDSSRHDLILFLSNAQPDLAKYEEYVETIFSILKYFDIKMVISSAAMPLPIDYNQKPAVWFCATDNKLKEIGFKYNLKLISEGQISGMNGLFLALAKKRGLRGFCLLGEIPFYTIQIENPKASAAILEVLSGILNLSLDLKPLIQQADFVEQQIEQLIEYFKGGNTQSVGPIGEEEIEKIKKSLSQYTKLPDSVKQNIERLFEQAKNDISQANILKKELDKWNVYKEYEDRFLDLFKRSKDKGN
ncbi:MAG: PAC2 family protein [Candidatus Omnitrophica bacterium]|nr:PAC2 family protein [Candidatus Omnitrophota bacterium]